MKLNGSRLKLVLGTGRIPCIDLDTGEKKDLFLTPGTIVQMATDQLGVKESALILDEGEAPEPHRSYIDSDPTEKAYYFYQVRRFLEVIGEGEELCGEE